MNELATRQQETGLAISTETRALIQSSIADSTWERYRRLSKQIGAWLGGQMLTDGLLATYITELHQRAKSPATISQMVAVAKWLANNLGIKVVGEIASKTLAGIRREGKDRGKRQVDGGPTTKLIDRYCTKADIEGGVWGCLRSGRGAIWGRFAATAHARVHKIKKIKFLKRGIRGNGLTEV